MYSEDQFMTDRNQKWVRHFAAGTLAGLTLHLSCTAPSTDHGPKDLVVLSYNIHHGQGTDGVFDLERIAEVINETGADLVALQEVDVRTGRASGVDQASELGRLTGMVPVFGEAMPYDGGSYGEAILSRWPIAESQVIPLPASPSHEPRAAVSITVIPKDWESPIRFVGTHLDNSEDPADRTSQVVELLSRLNPLELPTLLVGDFNSQPNSVPMQLIFQAGWTSADPLWIPTYPSISPEIKIDWILQSPGCAGQVTAGEVLIEPLASDHCPYQARWTLP